MRILHLVRRAWEELAVRSVRLSMWGLERGPHITRYVMYRRLREVVVPDGGDVRVLSISHSTRLCHQLGLNPAGILEANYPEVKMTDLPYGDREFDYVVSDQVLEHVRGDPFRAIAESRRVLKPGGLAIHTTCFVNPVHGNPEDFWRFTPDALRYLATTAGFSEVIEANGWGNFSAWFWIRAGLRFDGVPEAGWHPFHRVATRNDPEWPIVTWLVARR